MRYFIAMTITFATGYIMGYRPDDGFQYVLLSALIVIICAWSIGWIFAFFGVIARNASSVQGISMMALFPLTFLSNAFVPVDTLPSVLEWFARVNPISHLITAVREMTNNGVIGHDVVVSLLESLAIVCIFAPLTLCAYMRKNRFRRSPFKLLFLP